MSSGDGEESYGFAPHGRLGEQDTRRAARPQADKKPPVTDGPETRSSSPNWAWLLIGFLLGSGGTLIGSSYWLQGSYVNPSVAMDIDSGTNQNSEANKVSIEERASSAITTADAAATMSPGDDEGATETAEETLALAKRENATSTTEGEVLLASPSKADGDVRSETTAGMTGDEVLTASEEHRRTDGKNLTVATADPLEIARTARDGPVEKKADRPQVRKSSAASIASDGSGRGGGSGSNDATGRIKEAALTGAEPTDPNDNRPAVTPKRPNSDRGDTGGGQRRATEVAKADPNASESSVIAKLKRKRRPSKRIYRVQLAAVNDEDAADVFWQELKTRLPNALDGIKPMFDRRQIDERVFFRIWIGAFDRRDDANSYCDWLKSKGQDCFVTRG